MATNWTIDSVRESLAAKKTSARELAAEFYKRIEARNPELNAYLALSPERAYAQADKIDALVASGKPLPALAGVPVAIKDVISTHGTTTTCGSKILQNYVPPYDATAVERLEAAGAANADPPCPPSNQQCIPAGTILYFVQCTVTTSFPNELIFGSGQASPSFISAGPGFTGIPNGATMQDEYENVSSPGSYTITFTTSSSSASDIALAAAFIAGPGQSPPPEPSLPCGKGNCEGQGADPVNLTNGNVWATQRDYSLPGLGGGLTLDRTWNSLWKNQRGSLPVAGMFGDSWRSTYEERLVSTGGNSINYYRSNGDGWSFQWNVTMQNYQLANPTNERATLVFNGPASQYTITFSDGTKRVFNGSGYLTATVDRNSNQVSIAYDTSNRITTVTDAASRTVTFAYANASFPALATSATDAVGNIANYTYDASGRLSNVTYPDVSQLNFAYDSNDLLNTVTDAQSKLIESHTYDSSRRGLTSQRANGVDSVTITYPSSGTTTLQDSLGNSTTFNYNTGVSKFITSVTGPTCSTCLAGNTSSFAYDANGNRTSSTDANGNVTTFTYDATGNILTRSNVVSGNTLTWTYTYNALNEVLTTNDPLNNTTTNTYDGAGNLLTTTAPSPDGVKPGSTTTFTYDTKGELQTITDPLNNKTTIAYFPTGLTQTITDPQTNAANYTYDGRGNRLTAKDALNNSTSFAYDAMNRVTKITYPDTTTTQFTYDTRGRRITTTDQNNKVSTYGYDDADRLTSVKDAANNITTYGYDTESNLTSIQDANNHTTTFHYNTNRLVDRTTFPSGLPETYGYDLNGNLTSKTDRKNQQITYTYDPLNRLTKKTYPDNSTVNYTYDNDSQLTQVSGPTGTYQFGFDNMGRLTSTTANYSFLTSRSFTTSYGYDAASNRTGFTDPEGGATAYVYDTLNRLQTLTPPSAFGSGSFGYGYDADSRRTTLARPNSVNTTYGYDTLSRLLSVTHKKGTSVLDGATYTLDNAGNRTSRAPLPSGTSSNFTYDAIYELLTSKQGKTTTESYTYDPVGNRVTSSGTSNTYNSSNELTAVGNNTTYTYDNNGNTLTKVVSGHGGGTTTYAWDFENRLTSVTLPGSGGTITFKYDPFARRIYKSSSSGTSIFAYDGDYLIEETNASGGVVARYSQGLNIDEPLGMLRGGVTSYYEADGLGSLTSLSNTSGTLANTYTYDSFGNLVASSGSLVNSFRYTGREFDSETNLYYYRNRYYDPAAGRFISEDPIGLNGGINFYGYVSNHSTDFVDPRGLAQRCCRPADVKLAEKWAKLTLQPPPCHCFIRTSDGTTLGGYFSYFPFDVLVKRSNDKSDKVKHASEAECKDLPGSPCSSDTRVKRAFDAYPKYRGTYGIDAGDVGTSNRVASEILGDAGFDPALPSCAWGQKKPDVWSGGPKSFIKAFFPF